MKLYNSIKQSQIAPFITIKYNSEYDVDKIERALAKIESKDIGRKLLNQLMSETTDGRKIDIIIDTKENSGAMPILTDSQLKKYKIIYNEDEMNSDEYSENINSNTTKAIEVSKRKVFGREGVSVILRINPNEFLKVNSQGDMLQDYDPAMGFVTLAHELIHALHYMKGKHRGKDEENYTVGLKGFEKEEFTENSIRKEHGINLRQKYFFDSNDYVFPYK